MRVVVLRRARAHESEIITWYEDRRPGYGYLFLEAVHYTYQDIKTRPLHFPLRGESVRAAHVPGFPYRVYFQLLDDRILILSVIHTARRSSAWHEEVWNGDE